MTFDISGLAPAKQQANEGVTVFALSDGDLLPVPHPPGLEDPASMTQEQHAAMGVVLEALKSLGKLEAQRVSVRADQKLSDIGKADKLSFWLKAAAIEMQVAEAEISRMERSANEEGAKLLEPPAIDKTDVVSALLDMELRNLMRAGGKASDKMLQSLADEPRLVEAALRSPVKIPGFSEAARKVWDEHVENSHPDARRIRAAKEAVTWARRILPHIAAKAR